MDSDPGPGEDRHSTRTAPTAWKAALILSVPKRLAPAAPLRNMIRRVLRESWRAIDLNLSTQPLAVMIRLRALPLALQTPTAVPAKPPKGRAVLRVRRTDHALKTVIRTEADSLLAALRRTMPVAVPDR